MCFIQSLISKLKCKKKIHPEKVVNNDIKCALEIPTLISTKA